MKMIHEDHEATKVTKDEKGFVFLPYCFFYLRVHRAFVSIVMALVLSACASPKTYDTEMPSVQDLLTRYNARARQIDRIWARAVVEMRWTDGDGKRQYEQGDGIFVYRKTDQLAMGLGKKVLTSTPWFWLGCDAERFWWFDLNPQDDLPNTAYVGPHTALTGGRNVSHIPIPPKNLIEFLGITPLPASAQQGGAEPVRGRERASVNFRIPVQFGGRLAIQHVQVGAITARPLSIAFRTPEDQLLASVELSNYQTLPIRGAPIGQAVPTRIVAIAPEHDVEIRINLESLSTDEDKFSEAQFDFDTLVKSLKPERVEEIGP